MAYILLEKQNTERVNAFVGAATNAINVNYQSGKAIALNNCNVSKQSSNILTIDTGLVYLSGYRVLINSLTTITIASLPQQVIDMQLYFKMIVNQDQTENEVEILTRPSQDYAQDDILKNESGTFELGIANFKLSKVGIVDGSIVDTLETIDIPQIEINEINDKLAAMQQQIDESVAITVDSSMSDTSVNPVQNNIVKGYIDEKLVDYQYTTMPPAGSSKLGSTIQYLGSTTSSSYTAHGSSGITDIVVDIDTFEKKFDLRKIHLLFNAEILWYRIY